jgi:hypothetical protein
MLFLFYLLATWVYYSIKQNSSILKFLVPFLRYVKRINEIKQDENSIL